MYNTELVKTYALQRFLGKFINITSKCIFEFMYKSSQLKPSFKIKSKFQNQV